MGVGHSVDKMGVWGHTGGRGRPRVAMIRRMLGVVAHWRSNVHGMGSGMHGMSSGRDSHGRTGRASGHLGTGHRIGRAGRDLLSLHGAFGDFLFD